MQNITRLFDFPRHQLSNHPLEVAFAGKRNGEWYTYSTQQFIDNANAVSQGLIALGLGPGDAVGNVSNNRPEWNIIDIGILQMGGVHVPVYPTITDADYIFIFNHAEIKALFISSKELYDRIIKFKDQIPTLQHIYTYDEVPMAQHWSQLKAAGSSVNFTVVQGIMNGVQPQDLATMIYTSGTTGEPKGVMLSHHNIVSNVINAAPRLPCDEGDRSLSFLPLCHSFERVVTYIFMFKSISCYYAESMETIGENLKEIKPHVFSTVPRLLEKVYDKIVGKMNEATGVKRKIAFWALDLGGKYELGGANGWWYEKQLALANKLVFSKWREALGGNVKGIAVGASALQVRLQRTFWAAQIPVLEGYGLTESSPVIAFSDLKGNKVKFGTVGSPISGVQVKIAEDGEILAKGENIMMGYYKRPDLTAETVTQDGWLQTGDVGTFVDGFLKITDRKKEIFKTSGGKYVAPQPIESRLKESIFIEQAMVVGDGQKFPAAFITPTWDTLLTWCKDNNVNTTDRTAALKNEKVQKMYTDIVNEVNTSFGQWEQIKKIEIINAEWTIDGGEMTPTLKLKRKNVLAKYQDNYNNIYN
jgi:long-chain acyl-CoA synthetase